MSRNHLFVPAKPAQITLDTLPELFAHWRAAAGGMTMTQTPPENNTPPERPDGITEEEWSALGDPGKAALVREREARQAAERAALAARSAKPAPPKQSHKADVPKVQMKSAPKASDDGDGDKVDLEALIKNAVEAATAPFREAEEQRQAEEAANRIRDAVIDAAKQPFDGHTFHDPTDALAIDLTQVTNGNGGPDAEKIKSQLGDLLKRKPHLGKVVDTRRTAAPGSGAGAGGASVPLENRVQDTLARMQASAGLRQTTTKN